MSGSAETMDGSPDPDERAPPPEPVRADVRRSYGAAALAQALALVVIGAVVAASPWWAPLLPWGPPAAREAALASSLDQLRAAQQQIAQQQQAASAAIQKLDKRLAALEAKPAPTPPEIPQLRRELGELQNAAGDLASRVASVENAAKPATAAAAGLDKRITALESAANDRAGTLAALGKDVAALENTVKQRAGAVSVLDKRVGSLAAQVQGPAASASADAALGFALMRISNAVAAGRPFAAEYQALTALARGRPALEKAAAPLANAAQTGVPSRAMLEKDLRALASQIAAAPPTAPASGGWASQAWQGLRGLIRIRRAGAPVPGPEGVVAAAEQALAAGDLKGAIDEVGTLKPTGGAAQSAAGWLRSARQRLAAETALNMLEETLAAGLGNSNPKPGPGANPAAAGGGPPG